MLGNLNNLGNEFSIKLPTDENGFTSRKCPNKGCERYFKIKGGTGLKGVNLPCFCPYCGYKSNSSEFNTPEQIEYALSVVKNQVTKALKNDLENLGRDLERNTQNNLLKLKIDIRGQPYPIYQYHEKQLETFITCNDCSLEFSIFGLFAFCPDCGAHNSIQILKKNLELSDHLLQISTKESDIEIAQFFIVKALETAVSTFDGYGRAFLLAHASQLSNSKQVMDISFQNISGAKDLIKKLMGIDISDAVTNNEWDFIILCFQKRHLYSHKMGIIDAKYIQLTNDPDAEVGHKINITSSDVHALLPLLLKLGEYLEK
jgi:hypothetical protein